MSGPRYALQRRWLSALFALFPLLLHGVRAAELPLETFFKKPHYSQMKLSPDGRYLAALTPYKRRLNIMVMDLAQHTGRLVTGMEEQDITSFWWANNDRLLFVMDKNGNEAYGLFGIDKDGTNPRTLAAASEVTKKEGRPVVRYTVFLHRIRGNVQEAIVLANDRVDTSPDVYRMDVRNGEKVLLTADNPGKVQSWVLDHTGVVRVAIAQDKLTRQVYYRESETSPWLRLAEFVFPDDPFEPLAFAGDNRTLYVASHRDRDNAAIYKYDPDARKLGERLFEREHVDAGEPILDEYSDKLLGFRYVDEKPAVVWIDPDRQRLQAQIDAALKGRLNVIGSVSENGKRALVRSSSDVDPGSYYLLDTEKHTLENMGDVAAGLSPPDMSPMKPIRFKSRDGVLLHGYLTLPRGEEPKHLPLVVHPHEGPWSRDVWGFDPEVQFLANRGYAVLQVNFRGSTGYGQKFRQAGFKQWGLAMQDDLTDGVKWLIAEGIVDTDRICIFGASYGGYAALMGLIKTPELYRCGIDYAGVTDLGLLAKTAYSRSLSPDLLQAMTGDPYADKKQLDETSPAKAAGKIKAPLLAIYGTEDSRVVLDHWLELRSALVANKQPFEEMVKKKEGHGYSKEEDVIEAYQKIDAFLKANLRGKKDE